MKKSKIISLSIGGLVLASSIAFAATYKTFTATERPDFKIVMDGEVQKFRDGSGNPIYPVIINGSTYLPLKATANLFGKNVAWDSVTGTATLGDKITTEYNLFDVSTIISRTSDLAGAVKGEQNLTFDIGDNGVSYQSAVKITNSFSNFVVQLNENYNKMDITLLASLQKKANSGSGVLIIRDYDTGIELVNRRIDCNEIVELKDIDIRNVKNLEFDYDGLNVSAAYFLNPVVK